MRPLSANKALLTRQTDIQLRAPDVPVLYPKLAT